MRHGPSPRRALSAGSWRSSSGRVRGARPAPGKEGPAISASALPTSATVARRIFEEAPTALAVVGPGGTVVEATRALCRLLGTTPDALRGSLAEEIAHPDDRPALSEAVASLLAGTADTFRLDLRGRRANGSHFPAAVSGSVSRDESGPLVHLHVDDLSGGLDPRSTLGHDGQWFRSLVEHLPAMVYLIPDHPEATYLFVSPQIEEILGYSVAEAMARPEFVDGLLHPDDAGPVRVLDEKVNATGAPYRAEYRVRAKDGRWVWVRDHAVLVRDAAGNRVAWLGILSDISAQRTAEASAEAERDLLQAVIDAIPDHIYVKDRAFRYVRLNRAAAEDFGFGSPEELVGRRIDEARPTDQGSAVLAEDRLVVETGTPVLNVVRRDPRASADRWWAISKLPLRDASGEVVGLVGSARDVTDLKRAEEARLEAERQFRTLVEQQPGVVLTFSFTGDPADPLRYHYLSPKITALTGYTAEEHTREGAAIMARVHPDDLPLIVASDERAPANGEPYQIEYRFQAKDGRWVWLRESAGPVRDANGEIQYWLGVSYDVTAAREAQEAVRRSEERFRTLTAGSADAIVVIDASGRQTYLSPSIEQVLGYSPSDLLGTDPATLFHPADVDEAVASVREALAADPSAVLTLEARMRHASGEWRWIETTARNHLATPAVNGVVASLRDVTARKQAEIAISAALDAQIDANAELERVNAAKSEFVTIVSHEFKTPLTAISGFAELIAGGHGTAEEITEFASVIQRQALELTGMVTEMLQLDRLDAGSLRLNRTPTDLNAVVAEVAGDLVLLNPSRPIDLRLDRSLPTIAADRDRLVEVVTNLVSNAVKYSPQGGPVTVATWREGEAVRLSVADKGIGIPADELERVFDRFHRVRSSRTTGIEGTGLGLAIVRQLVALHGGEVWAESADGQGSTFHVRLPIVAAKGASGGAAPK